MRDVLKVTPLIAEAVSHLKSGKSDPVFEFSSDCIKNAPTLFYEHLALVFRSFLIHGHISSVLMVSTLIPLLKDKPGDICASSNYRLIALSSLILKIFDWVIILLYGERLNLDDLQFSYQPNVSTNMCTWMAVETIQHVQWICPRRLIKLSMDYYSINSWTEACQKYSYDYSCVCIGNNWPMCDGTTVIRNNSHYVTV